VWCTTCRATWAKTSTLVIDGEETELDKTVVEKIGDPLMHLVRNAMDHGIEPPSCAPQRGKPVQGTLKLNAFHDSGASSSPCRTTAAASSATRFWPRPLSAAWWTPATT
jgi:hypothetical protein